MRIMPFRMALALILLAPAPMALADAYDGQSVVRVMLRSQAEFDTVMGLTDDVWSHEEGVGPLDIRLTPAQRIALNNTSIPFTVLIPDLGALLRQQAEAVGPRDGPPFGDYANLAGINAYMDSLAALRPDLCSVVSIGNSYENRPIRMLYVHAPNAPASRAAVFYNGCQHAREWVTPPVTMYIGDQLIRNYDTNAEYQALLARVSFCLVPVVNVDGYLFTANLNNRFWRKNRHVFGPPQFQTTTYGTDLNRNWGYQWGGEGSSSSRTSDTYRGPAPFSEPETQVLSNFMSAHPEVAAYIDFHSYSQLLMWPWAYTGQLPADQSLYLSLGTAMQASIHAAFGRVYTIGPVYTTIYPAAGASLDWTYGARAIKSYAYELRDTGQNGFALPIDQILPNCQEVLPSALMLADRLTAPGDFNGDMTVTIADVPPFVAALVGTITTPDARAHADVNSDGAVDGDDIAPFMLLLDNQ